MRHHAGTGLKLNPELLGFQRSVSDAKPESFLDGCLSHAGFGHDVRYRLPSLRNIVNALACREDDGPI